MSQGLRDHLMTAVFSADDIAERTRRIAAELLSSSATLKTPDFRTLSTEDLKRLFHGYDRAFMSGRLTSALERAGSPVTFRLSRRMTRAGGKTQRFRRTGQGGDGAGRRTPDRFEIVVSTTLLYQSFNGDVNRTIVVNGLECRHRLDALQRIMEHEIVHLAEMVAFDSSSCRQPRFRSVAARFFGHTGTTHQLVNPSEVAAVNFEIRVGTRVSFEFDGRRLRGLVNRVTRRATVLVESRQGVPYSDGRRYEKYYVPLALLRKI